MFASRSRQHGAQLYLDRIQRRRVKRLADLPPSEVGAALPHGLGALGSVDEQDCGHHAAHAEELREHHGAAAHLPISLDGADPILGPALGVRTPSRVAFDPREIDRPAQDLPVVAVAPLATLDAAHAAVGPQAERDFAERSRGDGERDVRREEG